MLNTVAFLEPWHLALMIPIIALMTPIVAMLIKHQQQMAEILRRPVDQGQLPAEIQGLREEVRALKQLVHEQTLQMDSLISNQRAFDSSRLDPNQEHRHA
jgi:hypothetical protein